MKMESKNLDLARMGVYCLYNKETKIYDTFVISFDDSQTKDWFLEQISQLAYDLASKGDEKSYNQLMSRLDTTCIMRLATFDKELGVFINEQVVLVDYIKEENIIEYFNKKDNLINKFKKESDEINGK